MVSQEEYREIEIVYDLEHPGEIKKLVGNKRKNPNLIQTLLDLKRLKTDDIDESKVSPRQI